LTVTEVSSTRHLPLAAPRRLARSRAASSGAKRASHARTASWVKTKPRARHSSGQAAEAQRVAQPPRHHEQHDIRRRPHLIERRAGPLVDDPAASVAAECAVAQRGAPGLLGGRGRGTMRAGRKPLPTFSDTLALVRRGSWARAAFCMSARDPDMVQIPRALLDRLTDALCYAA